MRLTIVGYGEGGGIDDDFGLQVLKKLFHGFGVSYVDTDIAIVPRMRADVIMQGAARYLIGCVAREIIEDAPAGKTVRTYDQYLLFHKSVVYIMLIRGMAFFFLVALRCVCQTLRWPISTRTHL